MSGFADVIATVRAKLETSWTVTPIFYVNSGIDAPTDGSPWVLCRIEHVSSRMTPIGSAGKRAKQDHGVIAIDVFVPPATDVLTAHAHAKQIGDAMQMQRFGGVETGGPRPAGEAGNGDMYRVSIVIPFSVHYTA